MQTRAIYATDDHVTFRLVGRYKIQHDAAKKAYVVIKGERREVSWFGLETWFLV